MPIKNISQGSLIGPLHIANELPNQDYARFLSQEQYTIIALADGAGSLERSDEGAKLAVDTFIKVTSEAFDSGNVESIEGLIKDSFVKVTEAISDAGLMLNGGSTLVVALVRGEEAFVAAVGDSFAVIQTSDNGLHLLQPPPAGEFANVTKLMTSESYVLSIASLPASNVKTLVVCSDAFDLPTLVKRQPIVNFWGRVFSLAHNGSLTVDSLLEFMKGKDKLDDDATAVLACFDIDNDDTVSIEYKNFNYTRSNNEFVEIIEDVIDAEEIIDETTETEVEAVTESDDSVTDEQASVE